MSDSQSRSPSPLLAFAIFAALAALLVTALAFDPVAGQSGVDNGPQAKRAVLQLLAFAGLAGFVLSLVIRGRERITWQWVDGAAVAYLLLCAGSAWWAINPDDSYRESLTLAAVLCVAFFVRTHASSSALGLRQVLVAVVGGAVAAALTDSAFMLSRAETITLAGAGKFGSRIFPHQNVAALVYAAPAAIALVFAASRGERKWRILAAAAAAILAAALYLVGSKGALIGLALGPLGFWLAETATARFARFTDRVGRGGAGVVLALGAAALGTLVVLLPRRPEVSAFLKETFNRTIDTFGLNYSNAYMRVGVWKHTFAMFDAEPWTGVGLANYPYVLPLYDKTEPAKPHAHNQFMQVLAELGIPGLALFVLLFAAALFATLGAARRARETGDRSVVRAARAVGCALLVFALQSVFEPPLVFVFGALLFFALCALATSFDSPPREVDISGAPLLRFAILPGCLAAILLHWIPRSFVPLAQGESTRAALACQAAGDLDGARTRLRAATGVYDHATLHRLLGKLEASRERFEPALAEYRRAIELFPNWWENHLDAGACLVELDRPEAALESLARAEALMPGRKEARFWRGRAFLRAKNFDRAIDQLEAHRESVAESVEVLRYTADAYYERTLRDKRLDDCEKAHALYSRHRAIGGAGGDTWVQGRIDQLGHWLRLGTVLPDDAPGEVKSDPRRSAPSDK